jgi:hypothetical protein
MTEKRRDSFRLGFLTAIHVRDRGHVGGMLVTNHLGRPLEFQCTAPVQPNRTQEILYGPSLLPYLLGEVVGRTLVEKMRLTPELVLLDDPRLLPLREHVSVAVARVEAADEEDESDEGTRLLHHPEFPQDAEFVARLRKAVAADADLAEPFQRVRDALHEVMGTAVAERHAA